MTSKPNSRVVYKWDTDAAFPVDDDEIVVEEVHLPLLHWQSVDFVLHQRRKPSTVERLAMETALRLKTVEPEDLYQIAEIPLRVGSLTLRRLTASNLLVDSGKGDLFQVREERVKDALEQDGIKVEERIQRELVVLPETNDCFTLELPGIQEHLRRCHPIGRDPLPDGIAKQDSLSLIKGFSDSRPIEGLDVDGASVETARPGRVEEDCPKFRARFCIKQESKNKPVRIRLSGLEDYRSFELPVPIGSTFVSNCIKSYEDAIAGDDARMSMLRAFDLDPVHAELQRDGQGRFRCRVNGEGATALAGRLRLNESQGISVRVGNEVRYAIRMEFEPADAKAEKQFRMDELANEICREPASLPDLPLSRHGIASGELLDHVWQRGDFDTIYSLREKEDFCHE